MRHRVALWALMMLAACGQESEPAQLAVQPSAPDSAETAKATPPDLESAEFPLLLWSAWVAEHDYFDPQRFAPREQVVWATRFMGLHTPEFFAEADSGSTRLDVTVRSAERSFQLQDLSSISQAARRLQDILSFTQSVLDLDEEDRHELEYVAINGFFSVLDPHSVLLTPEEHAELGVRTRGEFAGIGAEIRPDARRIRIVRVIEGGPAEKAGLQAGDLILRIDEQATVNMTGREAQQILRGAAGSVVRLVVRRSTGVLTIQLERGVIRIPSVESNMLPDGVGYVRLSTFQESTGEHLSKSLRTLTGGGMRGLVLDLRGNSGGLLTQAVTVLDQFVDDGELVIVRSALGRESEVAKPEVALSRDIPIVALIDEHAASAAEIVAGGLQALGRGVVIGRDSFGKGTVQMLKPASPYGRELALKLTVAEYRVAGDIRIQSIGVRPDLVLIPVELSDLQGVARFFDRQRFEQARERSRTAHLPSARNDPMVSRDDENPPIPYVWQTETAAGLGDGDHEMRDPEIRLAHRVADGLASPGSGSWSDRLTPVAERLRVEEDRNTVRVLDERFGIDWTQANDLGATPPLHVEASVETRRPIEAGKPFRLTLNIENRGQTEAKRVHLVTRCAHEELDGIELLVGAIGAGKSAHRTLQLQVLPWRTSFIDVLDIDLHVGDSDPVVTASVDFEIEGREHPTFHVDHWIVDDPDLVAHAPKRPEREPFPGEPEFEVQGNGDGILQRGEKVLVAFEVQNEGPGPGEETYVVLRNLSGKQGLLEEGTMMIGNLPPGGSRSGAFGLTIKEDADPRVSVELELMVGDARAQASVRDQMRLRIVERAHRIELRRGLDVVGPEEARVYSGAHASANIIGRLSGGSRIRTLGRIDGWAVIESPERGRRLFVPADLFQDAGSAPRGAPSRLELRPAVVPPVVELAANERRTAAPEIRLEGVVRHPEKVRDIMISVLPSGPNQLEQKVFYGANPHRQGDPARVLPFATSVPLEPGSNRITLIARDDARIERQVDVWVYRDAPHRGAAATPSKAGTASEPSLGQGRP